MKLFIDSGHGGADTGAVAIHNGRTFAEKDLCWDLATRIKRLHGDVDVRLVDKSQHGAQYPSKNRFRVRVAQAVAFGADVFVSIHWNDADAPAARGTEAWFAAGDERGRAWASMLADRVHNQMRTLFRGAHADNSNENHSRLGILHGHLAKTKVCLLEVGFISNLGDVNAYIGAPDHLAQVILQAARDA